MTKKLFVKLLLFAAGLFLIMHYLTMLFTLKDYPVPPNVNTMINPYTLAEKQDGFYSLDKNSLDVVFIGSSHIHCGINPNIIWDRFGITSYDYSCDLQELGTSYYYLRQVFETQSPKVVIVDVNNNFGFDTMELLQAHFAFDHMKNDIHRFSAIWDLKRDSFLELYFPLITYHTRWQELKRIDLQYRPNRHNLLNGSFVYMSKTNEQPPEIPDDLPQVKLSQRTIHWIESIRKLCRENNAECIFIKTPGFFYDLNFHGYLKAIDAYCRKNDIQFFNFNQMTDEIGLDPTTDYRDSSHLNFEGQVKFSTYLGSYLQEKFGLENKKELPEYAQRNVDYSAMMDYIKQYRELYGE